MAANEPFTYPPMATNGFVLRSSFIDPQSEIPPTQYPLSDQNYWYYPSHGHESDDDVLNANERHGNWGNKMVQGSRWVRRGKIAPWGPAMDDWEAEERARKRIKHLLGQSGRSPSPPSLPHLSRSPSPPVVSPYPPPVPQHLSYSSFVMDKAVTHTFRSKLLDELEQATNGLIEGEATLRRALGRLWQVINEEAERRPDHSGLVPKQEEGGGAAQGQQDGDQIDRVPDLTPSTHKMFLLAYPDGENQHFEPSHFTSPEVQLDTLEKSLATLRELQDDGREYVERLQEIREGLGDIRAQRDNIWDVVRERGVKELREVATHRY